MKFGIDKAAESICEHIRANMVCTYNNGGIESPTERLLWMTFWTYSAAFAHSHVIGGTVFLKPEELPPDGFIGVRPQVEVIDWPVDFVFVILSPDGHPHRLAVECDGHDFHERTKEQAARDRSRDRALQTGGYTVMRFTGSEIHRDPLKCVLEVFAWAKSKILDQP